MVLTKDMVIDLSQKVTTRKLEKAMMELESEEGKEEKESERYWCPYCGRPLDVEKDYVRGWRFHSSKGGAYFMAKIYKCPKCQKKVRIVKKEPGIPLKRDDEE